MAAGHKKGGRMMALLTQTMLGFCGEFIAVCVLDAACRTILQL